MYSETKLLEFESLYCSYGDTVHYIPHPKVFKRSEGSYIYDSDGTPYLDLQMWYSACNFGYKNERINSAIKDQMDRLGQLASQFLSEEKILLATRLCKAIEKRFHKKGRIHFNVGGSQAIEDTLKLLRNATPKYLFFAFMGGYHGRTLGATSITSSYRYREQYGFFADRAMFVPYPYCFRCFYGKTLDNCDYYCVEQFRKLFESEYYGVYNPKTGGCEFGAFFVEAVQGTGGYVIPPPEYFPKLKKILDDYHILLVDDEIQMGFYRTGKMFALEHFGVTPDVIVFGKSLTNGMNPLAGLWAQESLIAPHVFPPGSTHSTFSSNPIGMRAGLEVMNIIEEQNYEVSVMHKGKIFLEALRDLKKRYLNIGHVDGLGLALRIEICENDGYTPSKALTDRLVEEGLKGDIEVKGKKMGIVLDVGGYYKNVLTLAPSLEISEEEIDLACRLLDTLFRRVFA